jgi:VanZ family protein
MQKPTVVIWNTEGKKVSDNKMSTEKQQEKRILSGIISLLLMGVIFFFSSQPGESSDKTSMGLLSMLFGQGLDFALFWNALARKVAHVLEFGALAAPVTVFFGTFRLRRRAAFWWPLAVCVLYAISDELHQLFVEGRSCELADILVDSIGVLLAVLVVRWLIGRLARRGQKKNGNAAQTEDDVDALVLAAFSAAVTGTTMTERLSDDRAGKFLTKSFEQKILPLTADAALTAGTDLSPANRERLKREAAAQVVGQIRRTDVGACIE